MSTPRRPAEGRRRPFSRKPPSSANPGAAVTSGNRAKNLRDRSFIRPNLKKIREMRPRAAEDQAAERGAKGAEQCQVSERRRGRRRVQGEGAAIEVDEVRHRVRLDQRDP